MSTMDSQKQVLLARVKKLYQLFHQGQIPTLAIHEVHPHLEKGSRENYLYFTLPPCLNFQRSSPAMWQSALQTWEDPQTNYLFFPEKVAKVSREQIQKDLLKHKLSLQKNKHTDIWTAICSALHNYFNDDPRELFKSCDFDVVKIIQLLQIEKRAYFPYLSGPKLSNYWLFKISEYTDAQFKNMDQISIIPDTHVLQSTLHLELSKSLPTTLEAERLWKELLVGTDITPVQMHPVLWNWSRNNFKPEV